MRQALLAVLFATRAHADVDPDAGPKSPTAALVLAVSGSVVGEAVAIGTFAAGAESGNGTLTLGMMSASFLAPSAGSFYANRWVSPGMVFRAAGGAFIVVGAMSVYCRQRTLDGHQYTCFPGATPSEDIKGPLLGLGLYTFGAVIDIALAKDSARAYNRDHAETAITPTVMVAPHGLAPGLVIGGSF